MGRYKLIDQLQQELASVILRKMCRNNRSKIPNLVEGNLLIGIHEIRTNSNHSHIPKMQHIFGTN